MQVPVQDCAAVLVPDQNLISSHAGNGFPDAFHHAVPHGDRRRPRRCFKQGIIVVTCPDDAAAHFSALHRQDINAPVQPALKIHLVGGIVRWVQIVCSLFPYRSDLLRFHRFTQPQYAHQSGALPPLLFIGSLGPCCRLDLPFVPLCFIGILQGNFHRNG